MAETERFGVIEGPLGSATIVDTGTTNNRAVLGVVNGTPVFANVDQARICAQALNESEAL